MNLVFVAPEKNTNVVVEPYKINIKEIIETKINPTINIIFFLNFKKKQLIFLGLVILSMLFLGIIFI